jgi:hypothetical protein
VIENCPTAAIEQPGVPLHWIRLRHEHQVIALSWLRSPQFCSKIARLLTGMVPHLLRGGIPCTILKSQIRTSRSSG